MKRPASALADDKVGPESDADSDDELDWSYTARCAKEWSDDELLSHLSSKAFTIPARDYNPSIPFIYVRTEDGVITTLPHGYRLPLMFIAKYQWETTTRILSLQNRQRWEAVRDEILHLSRLSHVLFLKARAKTESSGMEKDWRCIIFDRVLTRFYKGWSVSSPAKLKAFISHFGSKEYDRDVLKHDWKRWALKGFFRPSSSPTVHLTEEDVNNGITAVELKIRISKIDNVWTLSTGTKNNSKRRPIKFMQEIDCSSSELTDFDLSDDLDLDEDDKIAAITHNTNLNLRSSLVVETPAKRAIELSEDDDGKNRSGKRVKLEEIIRSTSQPCMALADGPGSGDVFEEREKDNDPLPKFRVPRQTLHSHGWKRLSAMERQRDEGDQETDVVHGFDNSSTSISTSPNLTTTTTLVPFPPVHPDHPLNDSVSSNTNPSTSSLVASNSKSVENTSLSSSLQKKSSAISLSTVSFSSKSKGKQPESTSTNPTTTATISSTSRSRRNSAYVSIPSPSKPMKQRAKPPAPVSPLRLETTTTKSLGSHMVESNSKVKREDLSPIVLRGGRQARVQTRGRGAGANGGKDKNGGKNSKTKEKNVKEKKNLKDSGKKTFSKQHVRLSSSLSSLSSSSLVNATSSSTTNKNNDEAGEQGGTMATATTATAITATASIPHPPPNPDLVRAKALEIELLASGSLVSAITNSGSSELDSQQLRGRIRELKMKFLGFKDDLGRIVDRLEVLEGHGNGDGDGDGDLGREGTDGGGGGSNRHLQTEEKRKEKENGDCNLDIEMMGVSKSAAIPCYVDATVGVDALVVFRDVSVQTDEPTHHPTVASTTVALQTVDISSAKPLPGTDEFSNTKNLGKIKPTLLESGTDDSFPSQTQFMNTATSSSLSTIVDNIVSIKMLSMMQTLVKSSINGHDSDKAKLVENTTTATAAKSDSDLLRQPSPSSSSLSASASHSMDAYDNIVASLLDELKTIKEEARCREQSEKEDLLAMRHLHSSEVDALRRRLSYLESRNLGSGRWEHSSGGESGSGSGRWRGSSSMRVDSLDLDRHHHHHHQNFDDSNNPDHRISFRQQQYSDHSQTPHHLQNGLTRHSSSASIVNPEGEPTSTNRTTTTTQSAYTPLSLRKANPLREAPPLPADSTTTMNAMSSSLRTPPTPSKKNHSLGFSKNNHYHAGYGMDLDDDILNPLPLPLPVKSQRKHHMMALARTHFS